MKTIKVRSQKIVNTDPQRRCYNGCNFSEETTWTGWEVLEVSVPDNAIERRIKFWKELNEYAVSQRGESARKEFQIKEGEND